MSPTIFETQGDLLLRSLDIEQDIEALTQMWRESDDQWPGTVSEGAELTPEWTRQWLTKQSCLETLVWDAGDVIAGYCSIKAVECARVFSLSDLNRSFMVP